MLRSCLCCKGKNHFQCQCTATKPACKDKDSKSVHGLTDHRPSSPNTASWVCNVGSP